MHDMYHMQYLTDQNDYMSKFYLFMAYSIHLLREMLSQQAHLPYLARDTGQIIFPANNTSIVKYIYSLPIVVVRPKP